MDAIKYMKAAQKLADEFLAIDQRASETEFRELYSKMEANKHLWRWMNQAQYISFIYNTVLYTMKYDGIPKALSVLDDLYNSYKIAHRRADVREEYMIHEIWAECHLIQNEEDLAYEHLKKATFYFFLDYISYNNLEYFNFRCFSDYAFNDIKNNTICLAHPSTFNDPMDTILLKWNQYLIDNAEDEINRKFHLLNKKVYSHIKVKCFVRTDRLPRIGPLRNPLAVVKFKEQRIEDVNPLMWAHYADKHKGLCIKYKFPHTFVMNSDDSCLKCTRIGSMRYQHDMLLSKYKGFNVFDALFAKHDVWSYENEVRIVLFDGNNRESYQVIDVPEDSIQAIYLGLECSDKNRDKMISILTGRDIKLYQMIEDPTDAYKLAKKRLL